MGFWAGIKHALNSTLGTSGFKPLDKLLVDEIVNQTQILASDDIYISLEDFAVSGNLSAIIEKNYPTRFKATRNGSVRIKGNIDITRDPIVRFKIFKNSDEIYLYNTASDTTFSVDVPIQKNDILSFYLYLNAAGGTSASVIKVTNFNICGTLKTSVFDIEQEV